MRPTTQSIIQKLIETLSVKAVFVIPFIGEEEKKLFLIIKQDTDSNPVSVAELFQGHPQFVYRIYEETYAIEQLKEGNVFFLRGLLQKHLKYGAIKTLNPDLDFGEAFKKAADLFNKEHNKALDFQDGATFYIEKENYPQAAFMLHQAIELAFRTVELITMGKEKICHGIAYHQKYIQSFVPELGGLFSTANEEEAQLLDLLDTAYRNVRYDRDYKISLESIKSLQDKVGKISKITEDEFTKRYTYCKKLLASTPKEKRLSVEEITTSLKELLNRKYHKMGNNTKTPYYRTDIVVEDPLEVFYTVTNLLKVCVLAAEGTDGYSSKVISQPYVNIRNVLEFAIQLLPYEEMECLEQLIKSNGGIANIVKK